MPRGNGMGPNGQGPMTGRGAGYCAGFNAPGFANGAPGGGFGRGFGGGGRGRRNRFYATGVPGWQRAPMDAATPEPMAAPDRRTLLQQRKEALEAQLRDVNDALNDEA